jgi:hypothetical protein
MHGRTNLAHRRTTEAAADERGGMAPCDGVGASAAMPALPLALFAGPLVWPCRLPPKSPSRRPIRGGGRAGGRHRRPHCPVKARRDRGVPWIRRDALRFFPFSVGRTVRRELVRYAPLRRGRTSSEEQRAGREPIHNPPRLTWPAKQVPLVPGRCPAVPSETDDCLIFDDASRDGLHQ